MNLNQDLGNTDIIFLKTKVRDSRLVKDSRNKKKTIFLGQENTED